mmetsp:Transcript_4929/g.8147  ORF Transcript_4929/g.8147 Transcript_4929/m.8147 type:complete len:208 (+) Transcript_4929:111-734(+)
MANPKEWRPVIHRQAPNAIGIVKDLVPGVRQGPCCEVCYAPAMCPICAVCPCCTLPEYITKATEESTYVYVRENSVEFNMPGLSSEKGACCGNSICGYRVADNVQVVYYDAMVMDQITDKTRCCNDCRTMCCGGHGQLLQLSSPFCAGCCYRSMFPLPCVPVCCTPCCGMCMMDEFIWVDNAMEAGAAIKQQRDAVRAVYGDKQMTR